MAFSHFLFLINVALILTLCVSIESETSECSDSMQAPQLTMRATLGAGCYWGTEQFISHQWGVSGRVVKSTVGFMGGEEPNPSYSFVKTGKTGHVEVLDVELSDIDGVGSAALYEELIRYYFQFHDPTTLDRQGHDIGTQYASVIFVYDELQRQIAAKVKNELNDHIAKGRISQFVGAEVTTAILDASQFYPAEEYHQSYLVKNPDGECNHELRFTEWPQVP